MEELKPCPLCGKKPTYNPTYDIIDCDTSKCPFCGNTTWTTAERWDAYRESFFNLFRERDEDRVELYLHIGEDVIKIEVPESERNGIYWRLMKHVVSGHPFKMVTFHGEVTK